MDTIITAPATLGHAATVRDRPKMNWKLLGFFFLLLGAVTALSLLVLSKQSLRLDEAQSIWQSSHSPTGFLYVLSQDVHVPLYGLMLHFWELFFGNQVGIDRLLSLLFFLASIPAMYLLAKTVYSKPIAIFSAVLLATSPFLNWYANEIRMYSMLVFFTIINQYFYMKIYRAKRLNVSQEQLLYLWWAYGAVSLLGVYTHYFFWLILLTEGLFYFMNSKDFPAGSLRNFFIVAALLALSLAPWLWYVKKQSTVGNQAPLLIKPTSVNLFNVFSQFLFGFQDDHLNTAIVSLWPLSVLFAFLGLRKARAMVKPTLFFLLSALLPIIIAFFVSIFIRPVFVTRYLIMTAPALYIFIAWFFSAFPPKFSTAMKVIFCSLMLFTLYRQTTAADTPVKENYQQASRYIAHNASAQDVVVLSAPFTIYPFEYYYNGSASLTTLPIWNPYRSGAIPPFSLSTLPQQVDAIKADHEKIWLLLSYDQGYQNDIYNYFETHFQRIERHNFSPGMDLYIYQIRYTANP